MMTDAEFDATFATIDEAIKGHDVAALLRVITVADRARYAALDAGDVEARIEAEWFARKALRAANAADAFWKAQDVRIAAQLARIGR